MKDLCQESARTVIHMMTESTSLAPHERCDCETWKTLDGVGAYKAALALKPLNINHAIHQMMKEDVQDAHMRHLAGYPTSFVV